MIFYQAWQLSAVDESGQGQKTTRFYSHTFDYYSTLLFLAASAIIVIIRPVTSFLYAPSYYESWKYVPFLVMAEVFSSLVTFSVLLHGIQEKRHGTRGYPDRSRRQIASTSGSSPSTASWGPPSPPW
jgi:hypothetical protein